VKTVLKVLGALLALAVVAVACVFLLTFSGDSPFVEGALAGVDGVTAVKDGFVGVFVLEVGDGRVALVDAGNDAQGKALTAELERRKLGREQVAAVFITHGHGDHTAAVSLFPGAEIVAIQDEVSVLAGRTPFRSPVGKLAPQAPRAVQVTRPVKDGEIVEVGPLKVEVFHVPGHTPGSAAYLARGVLFTGDSADLTKEGALRGSKWLFSDSQEQNRAALTALARRLTPRAADIRALAPSHTGYVLGAKPLLELAAP
jgi:glyoxylase-like metal-dependent hydrolase (beta-lactamase superfamily II)